MRIDLNDIWSLSDGSDTADEFPEISNHLESSIVEEAANGFPAGPEVWKLAWTLRRLLWNDLISANALDVLLRHDAQSGCGSATLTFRAAPGGTEVSLAADNFERSDAMHMEYSDEEGLFHWPEFRLENLEYEDHDEVELYEYSFSSLDRVTAGAPQSDSGRDGWSQVSAQLQEEASAALIGDLAKQMSEYDEIVTDHLDVLLAIVLDEGTTQSVRSSTLSTVPEVATAFTMLGHTP